jgi:hypothetical protein
MQLENVRELWMKVLGEPPSDQQFGVWLESHGADVVRRGILKAATKNLQMGGTMSQDHAIRFASKVMLTTQAAQRYVAHQNELRRAVRDTQEMGVAHV